MLTQYKVLIRIGLWIAAIALAAYNTGCSGNCSHNGRSAGSKTQHIPEQSVAFPQPNADSLIEYVRRQLAFGPRIPGTESHRRCLLWLTAQLARYADTVYEQHFIASVYGKQYPCVNILARLYPSRADRVLICAHWDSRPYADEDPLPSNRNRPVPGANDGGSGVAVVLELARLLSLTPPHGVGVDIALFDAEDMGASSDETMFCLGSKHFAQNFPFPIRPRYAILFDLVGDHHAVFPIEENSHTSAAALVERLWKLGALYGNGHFTDRIAGSIVDDHLPLISVGIPSINIIDQELVGNRSSVERRRYWHTTNDDLDNISGETMSSVARVVLALLYSDNPVPL
ncbi:MAG: M28 family peptidase [Chlorobi bacterium]|nr:M28 family peptidase [Chlorobiota bacterium]